MEEAVALGTGAKPPRLEDILAVHRTLMLARRNRAWEAREPFDLIDDVERELAVPEEGDDTS